MDSRIDRDIPSVATLADDLRRRMYLFVRDLGRPASRDEVAEAVGVSRKLAAFHLDKLLDRGLLTATYARPPGRSGRGAGRTAKYYAPSGREFEVTIPERRYDLMGSILVSALGDQHPDESTQEAASRAAHERGAQIGRDERTRRRLPPPGLERSISVTREVLAACGYEPYAEDGAVRLRNCPFHALAQERRDVVCSLNRELIEGIVEGLGSTAVTAELDPVPGQCCVRLAAATRSADDPRVRRGGAGYAVGMITTDDHPGPESGGDPEELPPSEQHHEGKRPQGAPQGDHTHDDAHDAPTRGGSNVPNAGKDPSEKRTE